MSHAVSQFQYIYESTGKTPIVTLSGGIDSQAVMYAAAKSKVPFEVVSMRFNKDLNSHDLITGQELAKSLGITIRYIDINIIQFYTTGKYLDYIDPYQNSSPQMAALLWMYEQITSNNNIIIGTGNPIIKHASGWSGMNNYTLFAWERFCQIKDFAMIGFFWWYSPALFGSLYTETAEDFASVEPYEFKCDIYKKNGFKIIPQSGKQNGFENVKKVFFELYPKTTTPYDTFYRYPHQEKNNMPIEVTGLI